MLVLCDSYQMCLDRETVAASWADCALLRHLSCCADRSRSLRNVPSAFSLNSGIKWKLKRQGERPFPPVAGRSDGQTKFPGRHLAVFLLYPYTPFLPTIL